MPNISAIRGKTVECKCERCKEPFIARVADRKRGWARFCSKSCKAIKQASAKPSAKVVQAGHEIKRNPPAWIAGMLAGRSKMFDPRRHRFEEDDAEEFSDAHLFSNEDHDCNKDSSHD